MVMEMGGKGKGGVGVEYSS